MVLWTLSTVFTGVLFFSTPAPRKKKKKKIVRPLLPVPNKPCLCGRSAPRLLTMPALFQNNERLVRLLAQDPGPEPRQWTATVVPATTRAEQHQPGLRLAWRLRLRWQPLQCWPESAGRTPTGLGCDLIPQCWVGAHLGKLVVSNLLTTVTPRLIRR